MKNAFNERKIMCGVPKLVITPYTTPIQMRVSRYEHKPIVSGVHTRSL